MTSAAVLPGRLVMTWAWSARDRATPLRDIFGACAHGGSCGLCLDAGAIAALCPQTLEDVLQNRNWLDVCGFLEGAASVGRVADVLRRVGLPTLREAGGVPPGEVWFYTAGRVGGLASRSAAGWPAPDMIMEVGA